MSERMLTVGASRDILLIEQDRYLAVREKEWSRLKRLIDACDIKTEWWGIAASVLFGIGGSAALSAITLVDENATNIQIIVYLIAAAAVIMGILCVIASEGKKKVHRSNIEEVKITIKEIEDQLLKE